MTSPGESRPEIDPPAAFAMPKTFIEGDCPGVIVETMPLRPAAWIRPLESTAMDCATVPSGNRAEYGSAEPAEFSATRKSPPCDQPFEFGKSGELVVPATQTVPAESTAAELTAIDRADSPAEPPRYVAQTIAAPSGRSLATN